MSEIDTSLLPEKHPQHDLFICDVQDAILKDIMSQMEHPFYSLSKKPEKTVRRYQNGDHWIEIAPSGDKGMATIYDKDILIYAISQLMAALNKGEKVSPKIKINTYDMLVFCNRGVAGKDYQAICDAISRLAGTRIRTNVNHGSDTEYSDFGLIDSGSVRRQNGLDGRLKSITITLSDWVFDAIKDKAVLTLNRDYFRLRRPIERRLYEIGRKHCGRKDVWTIKLAKLHEKTGSRSTLRSFRHQVKAISEANHLPDYHFFYDPTEDSVVYRNREQWWEKEESNVETPFVKDERTFQMAKMFAPDCDIEVLQREWVNNWKKNGKKAIQDPDMDFLAFAKNKGTDLASNGN